jgi:uncharacterized protein (TIGR00369 family)
MSAVDSPEGNRSVPEGFRPIARSGFVNHCTGLFVNPQSHVVAAYVLPEHLNPLGIAHGGFIATLADTGFGAAIRQISAAEQPPATINLDMDYLSPGLLGHWLEVHVEIHKLGRSISVASCNVFDGDTLVARGKGTFINNTRSLHGGVKRD